MSKTLMLMRHAKSSWQQLGLSDDLRPLNPRGLRDVPRMASWLAEHEWIPECIIASTAVRAITTAEILAEHLDPTPEVVPHRDLYLAEPEAYYQALRWMADSCESVMLVGHNPGLEDLVEQLSGEFHRMPTAAISIFEIDLDTWPEFSPDDRESIQLQRVVRPKEIR